MNTDTDTDTEELLKEVNVEYIKLFGKTNYHGIKVRSEFHDNSQEEFIDELISRIAQYISKRDNNIKKWRKWCLDANVVDDEYVDLFEKVKSEYKKLEGYCTYETSSEYIREESIESMLSKMFSRKKNKTIYANDKLKKWKTLKTQLD